MEKLQLLWVGQSYTQPRAGVKSHAHPYYHMFYIAAGTCRFVVDDMTYDVTPGTCLLVPRQVEHAFSNISDVTLDFLEIKFSLPQASLDTQLIKAGLLISDNTLAALLFQQIIKEYSELASLADEAAAAYLTALLNVLTENRRHQKQRKFRFIDASSYSSLSQKIIQYLESHYSEDVSLDALAEKLDYNKSYLCIAFKRIPT